MHSNSVAPLSSRYPTPQNSISISCDQLKPSTSPCPICNQDTLSLPKKKIGKAAMFWCMCLLITSGCLFFIPLLCEDCKDTNICCNRCLHVKETLPVKICWYSSFIIACMLQLNSSFKLHLKTLLMSHLLLILFY